MPDHRRLYVPGGTYFFTVALAERGGDLLVREVAQIQQAFRLTRAKRPFRIDALVVLRDHLHRVWTLPRGDRDSSTRWGAIKAQFTRAVKTAGEGAGGAGWIPALRGPDASVGIAGWNSTLHQ